MIVERTGIPEVRLVTLRRFVDGRGFFSGTWSPNRFAGANVPDPFVQDNHAVSVDCVVVRGLHIQIARSVQRRLVSVMLSGEKWRRLRITTGFLHGYCTLEPDEPALAVPAGAIPSYKDRALHRAVECSNWIAA